MHSSTIINSVNKLLQDESLTVHNRLYKVCEWLKDKKSYYDWVGFYFAEHSTETLHLGPFAGESTDHKIIPFGKGICGQVADSNQTFLVEDVQAQDNYIACSLNVKSEIVVPLFIDNQNVGQIDIDSNQVNAFSKEDEELLSEINTLIGQYLKAKHVELKALWV